MPCKVVLQYCYKETKYDGTLIIAPGYVPIMQDTAVGLEETVYTD